MKIILTQEVSHLGTPGDVVEVKAQLEGLKVTVRARAGTGGRLFGSITPAEVATAVKSAGGPDVDRRRIELPGHIKAVGSYKVQLKLHPEVTANFDVTVVAAK